MKEQKKNSTDNFYSWVRYERFTIILALFCAFTPIILNFKWEDSTGRCVGGNEEFLGDVWESLWYQIANIVFIFVTLFMLTRMKLFLSKDDEKIEKLHEYVKDTFGQNSTLARNIPEALFERINIAMKQFYFSWVSIWVIWLMMYVIKLVFTVYTIEYPGDSLINSLPFRVDNLLENSLNLLSSFILFFIYMDITISTVSIGKLTDNERGIMHFGVFIFILLGTIFLSIDLFSIFFPEDNCHYHTVQFFLRLFIGIIATMSLMAVLGRLNTSYLRIPQSLTMCLYLYATVQMLYPLTYKGNMPFLSSELLSDIVSILAFFGKGCLILVLQWISKENRFFFFLIHKANSLSDSDAMLRRFNKYYEGYPDK